ncbi:hypothetical protein SPI_07570 [Niveomyces insectorum RCEF 264]|uniref:Uncharacterized protein n=1 Tax=Niveomyces insectorum RCEF 264 TaxID=1081102 RepID=A0A167PDW2_9HYPO|nr:hypothetical protein SPI_07570 [Niveomyces insectorum RCEF 264]
MPSQESSRRHDVVSEPLHLPHRSKHRPVTPVPLSKENSFGGPVPSRSTHSMTPTFGLSWRTHSGGGSRKSGSGSGNGNSRSSGLMFSLFGRRKRREQARKTPPPSSAQPPIVDDAFVGPSVPAYARTGSGWENTPLSPCDYSRAGFAAPTATVGAPYPVSNIPSQVYVLQPQRTMPAGAAAGDTVPGYQGPPMTPSATEPQQQQSPLVAPYYTAAAGQILQWPPGIPASFASAPALGLAHPVGNTSPVAATTPTKTSENRKMDNGRLREALTVAVIVRVARQCPERETRETPGAVQDTFCRKCREKSKTCNGSQQSDSPVAHFNGNENTKIESGMATETNIRDSTNSKVCLTQCAIILRRTLINTNQASTICTKDDTVSVDTVTKKTSRSADRSSIKASNVHETSQVVSRSPGEKPVKPKKPSHTSHPTDSAQTKSRSSASTHRTAEVRQKKTVVNSKEPRGYQPPKVESDVDSEADKPSVVAINTNINGSGHDHDDSVGDGSWSSVDSESGSKVAADETPAFEEIGVQDVAQQDKHLLPKTGTDDNKRDALHLKNANDKHFTRNDAKPSCSGSDKSQQSPSSTVGEKTPKSPANPKQAVLPHQQTALPEIIPPVKRQADLENHFEQFGRIRKTSASASAITNPKHEQEQDKAFHTHPQFDHFQHHTTHDKTSHMPQRHSRTHPYVPYTFGMHTASPSNAAEHRNCDSRHHQDKEVPVAKPKLPHWTRNSDGLISYEEVDAWLSGRRRHVTKQVPEAAKEQNWDSEFEPFPTSSYPQSFLGNDNSDDDFSPSSPLGEGIPPYNFDLFSETFYRQDLSEHGYSEGEFDNSGFGSQDNVDNVDNVGFTNNMENDAVIPDYNFDLFSDVTNSWTTYDAGRQHVPNHRTNGRGYSPNENNKENSNRYAQPTLPFTVNEKRNRHGFVPYHLKANVPVSAKETFAVPDARKEAFRRNRTSPIGEPQFFQRHSSVHNPSNNAPINVFSTFEIEEYNEDEEENFKRDGAHNHSKHRHIVDCEVFSDPDEIEIVRTVRPRVHSSFRSR